MFLNRRMQRSLGGVLLFWLVLVWGVLPAFAVQAQTPSVLPPASSSAPKSPGIVLKICAPPAVCFASKQARLDHGRQNNCQFLEDVCKSPPASEDNKGAQDGDQGFWGDLWSGVKGGVVYGYEFVKGLMAGLKDQVSDLVNLITNTGDVVRGLIQLGKAFFKDPKGTVKMLAELLGQEVVDTITRATQCGAYDLGRVIGENVNPALFLKLATKLTKYSGKLADAVQATKRDLGCASFAAGTLVLTAQGLLPIEQIVEEQQVQSRHERLFVDAPQRVWQVFERTAPSYRVLRTESESLQLTDEHPLWVQGKGWVLAQDVVEDDVLAGARGDTLVLGNTAVAQPLMVYNFSVAKTESYFVGHGGVWAHNAKCDITLHSKPWKDLTSKEKGFRGEVVMFEDLTKAGYQPVGGTKNLDPKLKSPDEAFKSWNGQTGLDGIFKKDGKYVIVESKATGGEKNGVPDNTVEKLTGTKKNGRQLSDAWIDNHLENMVRKGEISSTEKDAIMGGLKSGSTKRVYVQTDANGTSYHEVRGGDKNGNNGKPGTLGKEARVMGTTWKP